MRTDDLPMTAMQAPRDTLKTNRRAPRGQASVLMAVIIALLFALFGLVFEVGRLLIAREVVTSAARRAGEAGLSYIVDYARNRGDWNQSIANSARNTQVWQPFYEENTGIPKWVRAQTVRYLQLNLRESLNLVLPASIDSIKPETILFPYKEANWPTSTIGARVQVTVQVPLMILGGFAPSVPITVDTISIASVEELLGIPTDGSAFLGAGGSFSEFNGTARRIPNGKPENDQKPDVIWVEPFERFLNLRNNTLMQSWGCPKEYNSAYAYAGGRHAGLDFGLPEGTRLFAVAKGIIMYAGPYRFVKGPPVGNNSVTLLTEDRTRVTYMHMLDIAVKTGQPVEAGDYIGMTDGDPALHGSAFTGFSSGPHLHFQVAMGNPESSYDSPTDQDPTPYIGMISKAVKPNEKGICIYGP
jgi:murein DD-endopeptidase MepM/ murein hydrolase activator NlpD